MHSIQTLTMASYWLFNLILKIMKWENYMENTNEAIRENEGAIRSHAATGGWWMCPRTACEQQEG